MKIQFTIEPSDDTDEYVEVYTAILTLPNDAEVVVRATEDDVGFEAFRAGVLEDVLVSLCESVNLPLEIDTEDYALPDDFLDEDFGRVIAFPQLAPPMTAEDFGDTRTDGC